MQILALDKNDKYVPYSEVYGKPLENEEGRYFQMVLRNHDNGCLISTIKRKCVNTEDSWLYETAVFKEGEWDNLFSWDSTNRDDALEVHKNAVKKARLSQFSKKKEMAI